MPLVQFKKNLVAIIHELLCLQLDFEVFNNIQSIARNEKKVVLEYYESFFWRVFHALDRSMTITTAALFDNDVGTIGIYKLRNSYKTDPEVNKHFNPIRDQIAESDDKLTSVEPMINTLITHRNKVWAHNDKGYFLQREKIGTDFAMTYDDHEFLVEIALDYCNVFYRFDEGLSLTLDNVRVLRNTDTLFDDLYNAIKSQ